MRKLEKGSSFDAVAETATELLEPPAKSASRTSGSELNPSTTERLAANSCCARSWYVPSVSDPQACAANENRHAECDEQGRIAASTACNFA